MSNVRGRDLGSFVDEVRTKLEHSSLDPVVRASFRRVGNRRSAGPHAPLGARQVPQPAPVMRRSGTPRRACVAKRELRLGLLLAFLPLFLLQPFLLFRVLLLQMLRLLLMLLLHLVFLGRIGLLLREFRVFLLLLLLDSLPSLYLLRAELILLLLVLPVQLGVRGGLNDGPWRSRNLVRMDGRGRSRAVRLRRLSRVARVHRTCC